jgi:hypothetical protein
VFLIFAAALRMIAPDQILQAGFTSLPLSLLPTFLVPVIIATHVIIFSRLAREARAA